MKGYVYVMMFVDNLHEEKDSHEYGHRMMRWLTRSKIPYETTYDIDGASECTIWVKKEDYPPVGEYFDRHDQLCIPYSHTHSDYLQPIAKSIRNNYYYSDRGPTHTQAVRMLDTYITLADSMERWNDYKDENWELWKKFDAATISKDKPLMKKLAEELLEVHSSLKIEELIANIIRIKGRRRWFIKHTSLRDALNRNAMKLKRRDNKLKKIVKTY